MYVIALTGGIATGKSTVAAVLRGMNVPVIDADAISRELTAPYGEALSAIRAFFGDGVFEKDGTLNRKTLADIVFASEEKRRQLEAIIHPMVALRMQVKLQEYAKEGHQVAVIEVPLLYESGMESMADEVWTTYAPKETQIARLKERNGLTRAEALRRINSQMPAKERMARADAVIRTEGPREETAAKVRQMFMSKFESM